MIPFRFFMISQRFLFGGVFCLVFGVANQQAHTTNGISVHFESKWHLRETLLMRIIRFSIIFFFVHSLNSNYKLIQVFSTVAILISIILQHTNALTQWLAGVFTANEMRFSKFIRKMLEYIQRRKQTLVVQVPIFICCRETNDLWFLSLLFVVVRNKKRFFLLIHFSKHSCFFQLFTSRIELAELIAHNYRSKHCI